MSFGEGNKSERMRELESRNKALKAEIGKRDALIAELLACPVPPRASKAVLDRCREVGIEVDA